jgi:hypothetical protein
MGNWWYMNKLIHLSPMVSFVLTAVKNTYIAIVVLQISPLTTKHIVDTTRRKRAVMFDAKTDETKQSRTKSHAVRLEK